MQFANEGKKNYEVKANYVDPRGGCGCSPASVLSSAKNSGCTCGCSTTSNFDSGKTVGKNL